MTEVKDWFGYAKNSAQVVELVDTLDSGSSAHCERGGSSPLLRKSLYFVFTE